MPLAEDICFSSTLRDQRGQAAGLDAAIAANLPARQRAPRAGGKELGHGG